MKTLKLSFGLFALLAVGALFQSCNDSNGEVTPPTEEVTLAPGTSTTINFTDADVTEKTITFNSTNGATFQCPDAWVILTNATTRAVTQIVKVKVTPNTSATERTSTITFQVNNGSSTASVIVKQAGRPANAMEVTPETLAFASDEAGTLPLTVTVNNGMTFTAVSSDTWLTTTITGTTINANATKNETGEDREATITVTSSSTPAIVETITVTQPKFHILTLSTYKANFKADGTPAVEVKATFSTEDYSAQIFHDAELYNWITVKGVGFMNNGPDYTVYATANPTNVARTATFKVLAVDSEGEPVDERTVTVTQEANDKNYTITKPADIAFAVEDETKTVTIETTEESFTVDAPGSWYVVSQNGKVLTITASRNASTTEVRSDGITLTGKMGSTAELRITQAVGVDITTLPAFIDAPLFSKLPNTADLLAKQFITNILFADLVIEKNAADTWITAVNLIDYSPSYFAKVTFEANTGAERSATITLKNGAETVTKTFVVTQAAGTPARR